MVKLKITLALRVEVLGGTALRSPHDFNSESIVGVLVAMVREPGLVLSR